MKSIHATLAAMVLVVAFFFSSGIAEEKKDTPPVGQTVGENARQIADDAKAAYHETKEAAGKISSEVAKDAKKSFQEAKTAAKQVAEDVKTGFNKEKPAPDKDKYKDATETQK